MKILLTGGSGILGTALRQSFLAHEINFLAPARAHFDITNAPQIQKYIEANQPTLILNCAAYTEVDTAENDAFICQKINTEGVKNLLVSGIPLIQISTDYVFHNAPLGQLIGEDASTNAKGVYAKSKESAEKLISAANQNAWIIRTSGLFGGESGHFCASILAAAEKKNELKVVEDQWTFPTRAADLSEWIVRNFVLSSAAQGIYHGVSSGEAPNWKQVAEWLLGCAKKNIPVASCSSRILSQSAARPGWSALANIKMPQLPHWKDAVSEWVKQTKV